MPRTCFRTVLKDEGENRRRSGNKSACSNELGAMEQNLSKEDLRMERHNAVPPSEEDPVAMEEIEEDEKWDEEAADW